MRCNVSDLKLVLVGLYLPRYGCSIADLRSGLNGLYVDIVFDRLINLIGGNLHWKTWSMWEKSPGLSHWYEMGNCAGAFSSAVKEARANPRIVAP